MIDGKPVKFAIYQEQNKYFKNIVNNVVGYSKEEVLTKDGLIQNGIFTPVSGFDFSGSSLSLNDRILSLKPIDIRSAYGLYLEPRLFSKYTTVSGTLKGIIADSDIEERLYGKVLKWNISHEFGTGTKEYLNRVSFASVLDNFRPNNKQDEIVYQENSLTFDKDSFEDKVISAPKITKVNILDKISTENGVTYYKNNLIVEGTIDEKDPTVINFGSTKSIDALNNVQVGDKILEIASLTNGSNTFNQIGADLTGIRFIDYRNNKLLICPDSGMKVREMNDFTLENVKRINGSTRQDGFIITVASELMAVFCLATSKEDFKKRVSEIIVAYTYDELPIRIKDLRITNAIMKLMNNALNPNLVQTGEHNPALIHGGPFANIAHGCNSLIATKLALKLKDIVVTEAGFAADLGAEKFLDIKCQVGGLTPSLVVLVATIRALKMHGGQSLENIQELNIDALKEGVSNLKQHLENIAKFGLDAIVAINHFASDHEEEVEWLKTWCEKNRIKFKFIFQI